MDVEPPGASLAADVACGNVVVLRSFGKFFGLAGIRLGFAIAAPAIATRLGALLGPWAVSGPALAVGAKALADTDWIERTRKRIAKAANKLDAILTASGLSVIGGTSLFRLAQIPHRQRLIPPSRTRRNFCARFSGQCELAALRFARECPRVAAAESGLASFQNNSEHDN